MAETHDKQREQKGDDSHIDPIQLVRDALCKLRFGGIHMTIHEGKLVQIEVTEKRRFT